LFNTLLAAANLALNPIESNILVTNLPSTLPVPTTMTTQNGLEFPCTTEGLKLLGTPLGTAMFCQEQLDPCWLSYQCETVYTTGATRTPMGFVPILKQACQIKGTGSPLGGWNAFHALGQRCVRGPEGPVAVPVP
jgi:hypothetical protein